MEKVQKVKQDSIAEFSSEVTQQKYEKIAEEGLWKSEAVLIDKYFEPNSRILDIGCGTGRTTIPLYKMGYGVVGIDITPSMIKTAKRIVRKHDLSIDYQVGDATDLEFEENTFDGAIFANNGWVQIPGRENRQKALDEIFRVLKPGGIFIFTAHRRYYSPYYLLFWAVKWIKYFLLKLFGIKIQEIDFGDLFFKRNYNGKDLKQRQFIHITGKGEVEKQIMNSGFKLILCKSMGEIAEPDAKSMKASLSKNYNSYKSPYFYVCQK